MKTNSSIYISVVYASVPLPDAMVYDGLRSSCEGQISGSQLSRIYFGGGPPCDADVKMIPPCDSEVRKCVSDTKKISMHVLNFLANLSRQVCRKSDLRSICGGSASICEGS